MWDQDPPPPPFQTLLDEWLANAERTSHESADNNIHPEDSVSNMGSRSRARPRSSLAATRKSLGGSTRVWMVGGGGGYKCQLSVKF